METLKHYFLSPHLDDAIISCGGMIKQYADRGDYVEVVTIFQKSPNLEEIPQKMRVFADYSQRRQENKKATDYLGIEASYRDYFERAFQKPYLKSLYDCFQSPEKGLEGYTYLDEISKDIEDILRKAPDARIYSPLGVGNHIDHTHLFFSAIQAMKSTEKYENFYYYEDPYGGLGNSMRKTNFLSKTRLFTGMDRFRHFSLYNFINNLGSNFVVDNESIKEEMKKLEDNYKWQLTIVDIESVFEEKIKAIKRYPSQIEALGGEKNFMKALKRQYEIWDHGEPLWQCTPKK